MTARRQGRSPAWVTDRFFAAYDAVLDKWPGPVESLDLPSVFGTTRVYACGRPDASPLVLLHGGGATSTIWYANVARLSRIHRVYAVDRMGDAGRSVHDGQPIERLEDLLQWLDAVLTQLGHDRVGLCGHSYGAWLALNYALHAPQRTSRLALLDPTDCFVGLSPSYRLRAVPLFVRPSPRLARAFLRWETAGRTWDPDVMELMSLAADPRATAIVLPRLPPAQRLRAMTVPTLVVLAEHSRAHNCGRVATIVHRSMSQATTMVLAGASHHTLPNFDPARLNHELTTFFL